MKTYRMNGDNNHLYFHNMKKRTAREELITIMDILNVKVMLLRIFSMLFQKRQVI